LGSEDVPKFSLNTFLGYNTWNDQNTKIDVSKIDSKLLWIEAGNFKQEYVKIVLVMKLKLDVVTSMH